jgi:hypothetical protein
MKLGKTLAKGIEKGQNATEALKENLRMTPNAMMHSSLC